MHVQVGESEECLLDPHKRRDPRKLYIGRLQRCLNVIYENDAGINGKNSAKEAAN
jgi:hypothetical protein